MTKFEDAELCVLFEELNEHVDLEAVMLIGAKCRDIHQLRYRDTLPARTTEDVDLALAVDGWKGQVPCSGVAVCAFGSV